MNTTLKTLLCLLACFVTGVTGYYFGVGAGAKTITAISAQNTVAQSLSRIDASLSAIDKNDPIYSQRVHQAELRAALADLGTYSEALAHWKCSDRDRRITTAATNYFGSRAQRSSVARTAAIERALRFCAVDSATAK